MLRAALAWMVSVSSASCFSTALARAATVVEKARGATARVTARRGAAKAAARRRATCILTLLPTVGYRKTSPHVHARALGGRVLLDPNIELGHTGTITLPGTPWALLTLQQPPVPETAAPDYPESPQFHWLGRDAS